MKEVTEIFHTKKGIIEYGIVDNHIYFRDREYGREIRIPIGEIERIEIYVGYLCITVQGFKGNTELFDFCIYDGESRVFSSEDEDVANDFLDLLQSVFREKYTQLIDVGA